MNQYSYPRKGADRFHPVLLLGVGICPALATTSTAITSLGMGLATTFVLLMSSIFLSLIKYRISDSVQIPASLIVIGTFVTMADLLMQAYTPSLSGQLGIFIPLLVINCFILSKANILAASGNVISSGMEGLRMGLVFTMALLIMGCIREILGTGTIFGYQLITLDNNGILAFLFAPGAFITLGFLVALLRSIYKKSE